MWLTARELSNEIHVSIDSVSELRRRRRVAYINIGTIKDPRYRYQLPAITPAQLVPEIERVALLTYDEVAAMLGVQRGSVSKMVSRKHLKPAGDAGNRKLITIAEFRRFLAVRDNRSGQTKKSYSPILVKWLKGYIENREIPVQVLDALIKEASNGPTEKRSGYITRLWDLFDKVNAVLREIKQERNGRGGGN